MRVWVAGGWRKVTRVVGQLLSEAPVHFKPSDCWEATIDGRQDQLLAVQEGGLAFVTDIGLLMLPWADVSCIRAVERGSLKLSVVVLGDGGEHMIIHYGPDDRAAFRSMVPEGLLEEPTASAAEEGPGMAAPHPGGADPGAGPEAFARTGPGLSLRAARVSQVLGMLAVLFLICGGLFTIAAAVLAIPLGGLPGFLFASVVGSIMTALMWANLRLSSVVAEYIAFKSSRTTRL